MRKLSLVLVSMLLVAANIISQEGETNELEKKYEGPGKIVLLNGDEISGEISYSLTSNHKFMLKTPGEEKAVKYTSADVKMFTVNDNHFIRLKGSMLETFGLVMNKPDSKIQIIKLVTQYSTGVPSDEGFKHRTSEEYFCLFVKQEKLLSIADIGFTNKKIAEMTSDCEELSKKIANKDPEYKIGMMTTNPKKLEIITSISESYQNCN